MSEFGPDRFPDDLQDVADRLRAQRAELTPVELDRIKLRAMGGASRPAPRNWAPQKGVGMRARVLTLMVAALLLGGTAAGGLAGGSGGYGDNAGEGQYGCPPGSKGDMYSHGRCRGPHRHHKRWRDGGSSGYQWCDDGKTWRDWNGQDSDW
jgi:hypothetical protein